MLLLLPLAYAGHKCVWVHGTVRCHKDPSKNLNVEVRVYDRDGLSIAKIIDPDDLMGLVGNFFLQNIYLNNYDTDICVAKITWKVKGPLNMFYSYIFFLLILLSPLVLLYFYYNFEVAGMLRL